MDQLQCKVSSLEEECRQLRKHTSAGPQREAEERGQPDTVSELQAENQKLIASLQELQSMRQVPAGAKGKQAVRPLFLHGWTPSGVESSVLYGYAKEELMAERELATHKRG